MIWAPCEMRPRTGLWLNLQRLPHALRNCGWIVVGSERPGALKSMRSRDEHAESSIKRIGGDPRFMRAARVPAASDHRGLDGLAAVTGNAFDVENRERHTEIGRASCRERV